MSGYGLPHHGRMFADAIRNPAYARAIARVVRPGSVVLDIGTGTGLLAFLACRAGAARVHAVETGPIVDLARELARLNGFADRVEFVQRHSTELDLPHKVDVIVSDIRGAVPVAGGSLAALIDARDRLLAPGGAMIPRADVIMGAVVSAPATYRDHVLAWDGSAWGIDASPAREAAVNSLTTLLPGDDTLLTHGAAWATLDYLRFDSPSVRGTMRWRVARDGEAHGVALWFEAHLAEGVAYDTGPGSEERLYGRAFLPWPQPVGLRAGEGVQVDLRADYAGGSYVWTWITQFDGRAPGFRQSTFLGAPLSPETLARRAPGFRPTLGVDGRVDAEALALLAGGATLQAVAERLRERFPERFDSTETALSRAVQLAVRYAL